MSKPLLLATQILAAGVAAGAVALGPTAAAEQPPCTKTPTATVCQSPGSANVVVSPPAQAPGSNGQTPQNGPYGPSGENPPVG
ncbi:hypothetical protein [Mycolicibacterium setense]|uniref:Intersectin-EH binding protein Ibp1 n=1 Tax=Mycolicibacterium setense TaxID=431269 RepID=A0ABR4YW20_9MYCO|nr:hypothetical protein [Mycolicibacterium setense]KHO21918.1 hypothetical protein QQ25_15665 [Mycolicibacterium setense]KHO26432.1 hypothetical protein QQ44_12135 [Mycolicibacterium setense]MCV7113895.1 hypothetical protein [Mycolicibacterium setense]OBB13895.1 hypothetical protein A5761_18040 [Mycolicibacterium setense]